MLTDSSRRVGEQLLEVTRWDSRGVFQWVGKWAAAITANNLECVLPGRGEQKAISLDAYSSIPEETGVGAP